MYLESARFSGLHHRKVSGYDSVDGPDFRFNGMMPALTLPDDRNLKGPAGVSETATPAYAA